MAGEIPDLIAEVRTGTGKGAARQARREGKVPGVVYGGGVDPLAIQIPFNVLVKRGRLNPTGSSLVEKSNYTPTCRIVPVPDDPAQNTDGEVGSLV